jgi:Ca-activated chloride channel family protein
VLTFTLAFLALGFFQQAPTAPAGDPSQQGYRIGVAVDQIFLSINARSVDGGFVRGLSKDDFQVEEEGIGQQIVNFYSEAVPVHVVLLMDISGSTRDTQSEIRRAALNFAQSLSPEDRIAVIVFNYQPRLILNWTNDFKRIENALLSVFPKGNTVLHDALYVTFDDLLKGVQGKKAVILLTDGADTGSSVDPQEVVRMAAQSEAMVYTVSKLEEYWAWAIAARMEEYEARSILVPQELTDKYIMANRRFLQTLSHQTGGKVLDTKAFATLTDVYKSVADELKNQYYISYTPSNTARDGRWRSIDIRVRQPGVVVSTRPGYYAPGQTPG